MGVGLENITDFIREHTGQTRKMSILVLVLLLRPFLP